MRQILLAATTAVALLLAGASTVRALTGNELLEMCTTEAELGVCFGYVLGIADMVFALSTQMPEAAAPVRHCAGPDVTTSQLVDVVELHLRTHPDTRDRHALAQVLVALRAAFPCN